MLRSLASKSMYKKLQLFTRIKLSLHMTYRTPNTFHRTMCSLNSVTQTENVCNALLARQICRNTANVEDFGITMLKNMNIEKYFQLFKKHPFVLEYVLSVADKDTNSKLAKYIFDNLEGMNNDDEIVRRSIMRSDSFCNLISDKILSDNSFFDKLDKKSLIRLVGNKPKKSIFDFLSSNKEKLSTHPLVIEAFFEFDEITATLKTLMLYKNHLLGFLKESLNDTSNKELGICGLLYWF